ncbi:hypothetical protein [Alicyclobacillus sp. SO9]|uniref:hypothetical protein n=1 Tax=Alicyclobacillus sp. SO9 TaxID=2665646 RepID=UPI0018E7AA1C|nr:hypothetical protein [Alicyclobacillus sp. SO9]QQE77428.1 hypothetical protein GI364_15910 [Alicyclobacillus sp. SO9]
MTHELLSLLLVTTIVVTDNALLAGLLLPYLSRSDKLRLTAAVAIAIAASQAALAVGAQQLLKLYIFRLAAIVILFWMAIETLRLTPPTRSISLWKSFWKVSSYTVVGNVDNMIWLGTSVHRNALYLMLFSLLTVPIFIAVALLLSYECERHRWVVFLGAGMPAWAGVSLLLDTPFALSVLPIYLLWVHIVLAACVVVIGLLLSRVRMWP